MKKNYFYATLLVFAFAVNLNAQFVELDGKDPVFHLKFEKDSIFGGKLYNSGTERTTYLKPDSTLSEGATVEGHTWAGAGSWDVCGFAEEILTSDNFEDVLGPVMYWPSWDAQPTRPNGMAAYASTGYPGPCYEKARTVCFYVNYSDSSTNVEGHGAHRLYDVGKWNVEGGGGMVRWILNPDNMQFRFDWGGANDYSDVDIFAKNEWTHLALTIPEGGARADVKFYINGIPKSFRADSASNPDMTHLYTKPEAAWDGIRICNVVNAGMADYRVYDSELSQYEIQTLLGTATAAPQLNQKNLFNIYPVPNNGVFKVEIADANVTNIVIRNTVGQVVYDQKVDQNETINVSHLTSGMYFVSLCDGNKSLQTKKFLIK